MLTIVAVGSLESLEPRSAARSAEASGTADNGEPVVMCVKSELAAQLDLSSVSQLEGRLALGAIG